MSMNLLRRFLTVSTSDPDDTRRRRILTILVVGIGLLSLFALITSLVPLFLGVLVWENVSLLITGSVVTIFGTLLIYLINYFWSGRVSATIFLVFLTLLFAFTDTPDQISGGRSLFAFTIPIIMASILLVPSSSFI